MTNPRGRITSRIVPDWANKLRARRLQLGMAQDDLVAAAGDAFSQRTVSALETGTTHLGDMSITRVAALARALNWSLIEMQRATGIDLGIVEAVPMDTEATPVLRLQDLSKVGAEPDSYAFIPPNARVKLPEQYAVVLADSNEMTTDQDRSIHRDDLVFVDLTDTQTEREHHTYVIEHKGRVHIRRYSNLPSGPAFTADNREYAMHFIPADQARVLGRTFRIVSDRPDNLTARLQN